MLGFPTDDRDFSSLGLIWRKVIAAQSRYSSAVK